MSLTPEQLLDVANESLDEKVDPWFRERGIVLPPRPVIKYGKSEDELMTASALTVDRAQRIKRILLIERIIAEAEDSSCGLYFSNEVYDEYEEIQSARWAESESPPHVEQDEIWLYSLLCRNEESIDETIAHERAHLIDFAGNPNISPSFEGIARYVECSFAGKNPRTPVHPLSFDSVLYGGATNIVCDLIGEKTDDIACLFSGHVRTMIDTRCDHYLRGQLVSAAMYDCRLRGKREKHLKKMLGTMKEMETFRTTCTPEGFCRSAEALGQKKMAEEMRKQDLRGIIRYYRALLEQHLREEGYKTNTRSMPHE